MLVRLFTYAIGCRTLVTGCSLLPELQKLYGFSLLESSLHSKAAWPLCGKPEVSQAVHAQALMQCVQQLTAYMKL